MRRSVAIDMPTSFRPETIRVPGSHPLKPTTEATHETGLAEQYRAILDALPNAIGLVKDHRIVWVNQAFTKLLGYSSEEASHYPPTAYFRDVPQFKAAMRDADSVLIRGETYHSDFLMRRKNGASFWGSASGHLLFPEHPEAGTVWTLKDVNERVREEEILKRAQERLEEAQEQVKLGSWELDANLEACYWSKQMYAMLNFDPRLGLPRTVDVHESVHPEDRDAWESALRRALATRERTIIVFRSNPAREPLRYFECTLQVVVDECGNLQKVAGTTQDVTNRKRDEEALRLSRARLERAQAQAKIGSWEYYPATCETHFSNEMYVLLDRDPLLGPPSDDEGRNMAHPEDRARVLDAVQQALENHQLVTLEHRGPARHGQTSRYFETTIYGIRDQENKVQYLAGTFQDVTDRRNAADALRDSERRLKRLLENSGDLIAVMDARGRQWSLRGPLMSMLGYEPAELEGTRAFELLHPDDIPESRRIFTEVVAHPGVPYRAEYRHRHKQGGWVEMEAIGTNWLHDPIVKGIVVNLRRITERKQLERERNRLQEQLQQAAKMEAVGRLAGGVAHDFNNLITVISGNVELSLEELNENDPLVQNLKEVGVAAESAASLTRQLLAFSRRQLLEPKIVNLNDLITSLRNMIGRLLGEDVELELRLDDSIGTVRIDPGQFDQVIVNLAVNARDAMPKGGKLTIETRNVELDGDYCRIHREIDPGAFVSLIVTDNGEGMPPEVTRHIFEPFFSTKPHGKGTGLGLSVTFGAVKQAGGTIETYSELGLGTTFKIYLPRLDSPAQKLYTQKVSVDSLRGTETILVVEDNDHVRGVTTTMLQRLGYRLLVASSGKNALALIQTEQPKIDLLLTDLVMPDMSGREVADRLRALFPNVGILYCSGYTEDSLVRHGLFTENLQFIGKPFTIRQLGMKIRQVLEEKR
jgi:PAS domain S-box-containing protein